MVYNLIISSDNNNTNKNNIFNNNNNDNKNNNNDYNNNNMLIATEKIHLRFYLYVYSTNHHLSKIFDVRDLRGVHFTKLCFRVLEVSTTVSTPELTAERSTPTSTPETTNGYFDGGE